MNVINYKSLRLNETSISSIGNWCLSARKCVCMANQVVGRALAGARLNEWMKNLERTRLKLNTQFTADGGLSINRNICIYRFQNHLIIKWQRSAVYKWNTNETPNATNQFIERFWTSVYIVHIKMGGIAHIFMVAFCRSLKLTDKSKEKNNNCWFHIARSLARWIFRATAIP